MTMWGTLHLEIDEARGEKKSATIDLSKSVRMLELGSNASVLHYFAVIHLLFIFYSFTSQKLKTDVEYCKLANGSISPTVGGCELGGLRSSSPSQGQVHRGAAEVNLDLTRGT